MKVAEVRDGQLVVKQGENSTRWITVQGKKVPMTLPVIAQPSTGGGTLEESALGEAQDVMLEAGPERFVEEGEFYATGWLDRVVEILTIAYPEADEEVARKLALQALKDVLSETAAALELQESQGDVRKQEKPTRWITVSGKRVPIAPVIAQPSSGAASGLTGIVQKAGFETVEQAQAAVLWENMTDREKDTESRRDVSIADVPVGESFVRGREYVTVYLVLAQNPESVRVRDITGGGEFRIPKKDHAAEQQVWALGPKTTFCRIQGLPSIPFHDYIEKLPANVQAQLQELPVPGIEEVQTAEKMASIRGGQLIIKQEGKGVARWVTVGGQKVKITVPAQEPKKELKGKEAMAYVLRGYKDAQEGEPYKRAPGDEPPELPLDMMPQEWQLYFDGWDTGIAEGVSGTFVGGREE